MTTTASAVPTAPQPPTDTERARPALLQDEGGLFRMIRGRRIPVNAPGIAILDGTPAAAAYRSAESLDRAIKALQTQYADQVKIVQGVIGDRAVAMLEGQKVVSWKWSQRVNVDRALTEAILSEEDYDLVAVPTPSRSFEPKYRG